jgi:predicted membrane-bound spermidine synthase
MKKAPQHPPASAGILALAQRQWALLLLVLLEGASLMGVELAGAKLITPYYGNSIYVWSAVLGTTLGGLALGYLLGGRLAQGGEALPWLRRALLAASLVCLLLPWSSTWVLEASLAMPGLQVGILLSGLAILTPPLLLFGLVSPLSIQLMNRDMGSNAGKVTGLVYAVSTLGGVAATFGFSFYLIPYGGLMVTTLLIAGLLFVAFLFSLSRFFANFTDKAG